MDMLPLPEIDGTFRGHQVWIVNNVSYVGEPLEQGFRGPRPRWQPLRLKSYAELFFEQLALLSLLMLATLGFFSGVLALLMAL